MTSFTFTKEERLKSRKIIQRLFKEGQSFGQYPLRLVWLNLEEPVSNAPVQFTVSVPKKRFRKAVSRNRIKRQVREAYRLQKHRLYEGMRQHSKQQQVAFMVIYTGKEAMAYPEIERAMQQMLGRFIRKYQPTIRR